MIHFILIVTPLILSVRTTPASNETLEDARSAVECNETWLDGSSVGLGYLWFETSRTYSYSSAKCMVVVVVAKKGYFKTFSKVGKHNNNPK